MSKQNNERINNEAYCPDCQGEWRYKKNNQLLICSKCGKEIDAKRKTDKEFLPPWEKESLLRGGY